jgi:hypothetical protein
VPGGAGPVRRPAVGNRPLDQEKLDVQGRTSTMESSRGKGYVEEQGPDVLEEQDQKKTDREAHDNGLDECHVALTGRLYPDLDQHGQGTP